MRGKLIVIEGTDCSGKETQSKLLLKNLNEMGMKTEVISFPVYNSPTGRIVGSCYLGKEELCNKYLGGVKGWFDEGAPNVDGMVASMYYAADRKYNIGYVNKLLDEGVNVILDRYIYSNMAHQACKISDVKEQMNIIKKLELLEFGLLELPKPDITFLLYVPYNVAQEIKKGREEVGDQHENDIEYLKRAEATYLMLKELYGFDIVECVSDRGIRTKEDISEEVLDKTMSLLKKKEFKKCLKKY